ncbi:MAG TPA: anthranilate synthase component I [Nevskiaceae bacterium]|nr:anthranilate synthase component I [Nevskiaceae bacterium]
MEPQRYNRIALTRELPGDLDTPVGAYLKLGNRPYSFLLESMQGGERWGRYSFIGLPCREIVTVRGHQLTVTRDDQIVEQRELADPIAWLRDYAARTKVKPEPTLPRFTGGLGGYFGYDCVRYFEPKLDHPQPDTLNTPDILLMYADELAIFDALRATLTLVVHANADDPADQARARQRLNQIEAQLALPLPQSPTAGAPARLNFSTSFERGPYLTAVAKAKEYIAAGDTFQVQLGQRLSAPFAAQGVELYRAIRRLNPSPYLYCFHMGDHHVVGSSPEILVRVQNGEVTLRPIAGTRPRGATPEDDLRLEKELLADPKERAEHVMLIDLGRNDVGRVCEAGVKVTDQMVIERYSHVMHIVSNVTGKLKAGLDPLDVLAATFPAGTLTGAPKVRTMEIIQELEPVKRGIYGGAVGYLGWDGNMDLAIAIRTAVIKDGKVHVQASAGIVADSIPQAEWDETLHKARAMMRAAEIAAGAAS